MTKISKYKIEFGKFRGQMLKDIDEAYLRYLTDRPYFAIQEIIDYVNSLPEPQYVFKFGKYKDKNLDQIYKKDKVYLNYITHQDWFNDIDIVKKYLENKKKT